MGESLEKYLFLTNGVYTGAILFVTFATGILISRQYAHIRGYTLHEAFLEDDNPAVILRTTFFVVSLIVAVAFAYHRDDSLLKSCENAAVALSSAVGAMIISFLVTDYIILRQVDNSKQVFVKRNLAIALIESATFLSTAIIFSGGMSDASHDLWFNLVWFCIGQVFLVAVAFAYAFSAKKVFDKALSGASACAFPVAAFLLSGGIAIGAAIYGEFNGWADDLLNVGISVCLWLAFMVLARLLIHVFIVSHERLNAEMIGECNEGGAGNWALGFLDGMISIAITVAFVAMNVA
jgi:hypothetical protein